jgi:acetyl esterase/lipase
MDNLLYRSKLLGLGAEITPAMIKGTRDLIVPLLPKHDSQKIAVRRDIKYGPDARHRLDLYSAKDSPDPFRPVLIFVHGGGFVQGDKHSEGSPFFTSLGDWAVNQQFNCVCLTYRLAPEHHWPSGVEDIEFAMNYLHRNASELGINAERFVLMGQSAGASHVASYVVHCRKLVKLKALVLLSGMYDWTTMPLREQEISYLNTQDKSELQKRSTLEGLLNCGIPLLLSVAELEPDFFHQQNAQLLVAWQKKHGNLPHIVHSISQNHVSVAMALGLPNDVLGPRLAEFISLHS